MLATSRVWGTCLRHGPGIWDSCSSRGIQKHSQGWDCSSRHLHGTQDWCLATFCHCWRLGHFLNSLCLIKQERVLGSATPRKPCPLGKGHPLGKWDLLSPGKDLLGQPEVPVSPWVPRPDRTRLPCGWDVARMAWGPAGLLDHQTPTVAHMPQAPTAHWLPETQWGNTFKELGLLGGWRKEAPTCQLNKRLTHSPLSSAHFHCHPTAHYRVTARRTLP